MSEFCNISHKQQMWLIDSDHVNIVSLTLFEPKKGRSSGEFCQKLILTSQHMFLKTEITQKLWLLLFLYDKAFLYYILKKEKAMTTPSTEGPFPPHHQIINSSKSLCLEKLRVFKIRLCNLICNFKVPVLALWQT